MVSARADVVPTLQTLQIVDRGNHLVLNWSFYYAEFPSQFKLKEKRSEPISLQDPTQLYDNLSEIVSVAFELRINGQVIPPEKIASLTIAPDKLCTVKIIYPGQPGGHLEVRAPVLQYLPPTYVINYNIFSLDLDGKAVTGDLALQQGPFSQVVHYNEVAKGNDWSLPLIESSFATRFKFQLRTVWINSNWLLIAVILLLIQRPRRAFTLLAALAAEWILLCLLKGAGHLSINQPIPDLLPGVGTAALAVTAVKWPARSNLLTALTLGLGILNACFDLQQIRWTPETQTAAALFGLCLGFLGSMALLLLVLFPILWEGKKNHDFQAVWAPRICWVLAVLALALPVQKWIFR